MFLQFLISCVIGCFFFWAMEENTPTARMWGSVFFGIGGAWLLTWVWARIRYGRGVRVTWGP